LLRHGSIFPGVVACFDGTGFVFNSSSDFRSGGAGLDIAPRRFTPVFRLRFRVAPDARRSALRAELRPADLIQPL